MKDEKKTKKQLISELAALRQRIAELEKVETERKAAEEALRVSAERLALVERYANDGIYDHDIVNDTIYWSPRLKEILGYADDDLDLDLETFEASVHPDDREHVLAALEAHLKDRGPFDVEERLRTKSGEYRWFRVRGQAVWDEEGRPTRIVGSNTDITERKRAEEALRDSEERYRAIFEQAAVSIVLIDAETGGLVEFNDGAHENLGYTRQEFENLKIPDFEVIESDEEVAKHIEKIVKEGADTFETKHRTKDGEIRDILVSNRAISIGGRDFIQSIWRDITERKRAEEALRENEERYRNVVERANDGIVIIQDTIIRYANPRLAEMWGGTAQEFIGTPFTDYVHPDELPKLVDRYKRRMAGQDVTPIYETALRRKDGSKLYAELNAGMITYQGKPADLVIVRDITERKQAEEALRKSEERYKKQFEEAMDAIFIADAETAIIVDCNRVASELVGREESELVGKHQRILHPPEEIEGEFSRTFKQHLKEKEGQVLETQVITKEGEIKDVAIKASTFELEGQKMILGIFRDITEQKRAEEALREKEENFRAVAENASEGILVGVGEGVHVYVNKRAAEITGYSMAELLETDMKGLVHPDEFEKVMERYRKRVAGKPVPTHYETIFIRKDGKSVPVEFTAAKTVWQGEPASVVFFRDITERKQAEEALAQEQNLLRALMDNIPDYIYFKDRESRFTRTTKAHAKTFGLSDPMEAIGKTDFDFFSDEHARRAYEDEQEIIRTGEPLLNVEERETWPDRPDTWVLTSKMPLRNVEGNIIGTFGISKDITERKRAEEAYRAVVDYSLQGLVIVQDFQLVFANQAFAEISGYTIEELLSLSPEEVKALVHLEDQALVWGRFRDRLEGKPLPPRYEYRGIRKDGTVRWLAMFASAIEYHERPAVQAAIIDITERKQAEEEAQKRLRETTALHRVSEVINSTLDLQEIFHRVVAELSSTFSYRLVGIYLVGEEGLRLQARVGYDSEIAPELIPLERGVVGRVARTGQPAFVRDVSQDPDYVASHPEITCEICVPVMSGGTTLGTLNVESNDKRPLTEHDLQLLSILSSHIGVAIENARLYEHSKKRLGELSGLYDISQAFSSMTDARETFGQLTKRIAQLIGCQMCFIATYDQRAREMHAEPPGYGISDQLVRSLHYKVDGPARESWNFRLQGPLLANDRAQIPDFFSWWAQYHDLFNLLVVPLSIEGKITGLAYAANKPGGFAQDDTRLLTMFASQAAIVIENARLFEDTESHLAQLSALQETTKAVASTLQLDELLNLITHQATTLLQADGGIINLVHWENNEDEVVAASGSAAHTLGYRSSLEGSLSGWVTLHDQPVISNQLPNDSRTAPRWRAGEERIQTAAIAPLTIKDQIIGTLVVMDKQGGKGEFDQADLNLLVAFANEAAMAIENARLYEETVKRLAETTLLHKVAEIINATLDPKEVFERVVEELSRAFGYRLVDIYLLEEDGLRLQTNAGDDAQTSVKFIPLERGVIGRVARTGQPALIRDATQDPDYFPDNPETTTQLCVPIRSGQTILGVLNIESDDTRPLTEDDLQLLVTLSSHIGVAIDNARLYEETQRLAITDGLTGLYNLRYFYEALEKEIKRSERYHRPASLIILDIDDFKSYNDRHGHLAGDYLLKELAQLMSKVTRAPDTLARYGGEEFTIILPETEREGAEFLAERLRQEVREHRFQIQDGQTLGKITISLGVATYPHHADSARALVDAADKALLKAKQAGKNQLFAYGEESIKLEPR